MKNVNIPAKVHSLPRNTFLNCVNLPNIVIPEGITSMEQACFKGCSNLELDLGTLGEGITRLGSECFMGCSKVYGEINLPNLENYSTGSINGTFQGTNITKVKNLGKVTSLYNTFADCAALRFVELPETMIECGFVCFMNCNSLRVLKLNSVVPPTYYRAFENADTSNLKIYVPDDSVEAYKQASGWATYADKIHPVSEYAEGEEDEVTE